MNARTLSETAAKYFSEGDSKMNKNTYSDNQEWWNNLAQKLNGFRGNYKFQLIGDSGEDEFVQMVNTKLKNFPNALDVGCADGRFTSELASKENKIIGVDFSDVMIEKAKLLAERENLDYMVADAKNLPFDNDSFDLVISRRGPVSIPNYLEEAIRVTKPGGQIVEITIGDKDAYEFKEIFNRGQGYTKTSYSRYADIKERIEQNQRIRLKEMHEYYCDAIYPSIEDVVLLLSSTPIIEDFDIENDYKFLDLIKQQCSSDDGIKRTFHRLIWLAEKVFP